MPSNSLSSLEDAAVPIPDFQTIMLPLLRHIVDGKEHTIKEITEAMADHFQLTEEERNQFLPSGKQKTFTNRVAWSKAGLKRAGCIPSLESR